MFALLGRLDPTAGTGRLRLPRGRRAHHGARNFHGRTLDRGLDRVAGGRRGAGRGARPAGGRVRADGRGGDRRPGAAGTARRARRARPFVVVACAGAAPDGDGRFADELAERFAEAEGGTLFLDEIADLSLAVQARLLALVESSDVRLVAATARRLEPDVRRGKLRE